MIIFMCNKNMNTFTSVYKVLEMFFFNSLSNFSLIFLLKLTNEIEVTWCYRIVKTGKKLLKDTLLIIKMTAPTSVEHAPP